MSATREKKLQQSVVTSRKTNQEERDISQELSTADDWKDFKMLTSSKQSMSLNRQCYKYHVPLQLLKGRINLISIIHQVIFTPRKGRYMQCGCGYCYYFNYRLSLDTSGHFERQASHVTMDLTGDEGIEIIRSKGSKKW